MGGHLDQFGHPRCVANTKGKRLRVSSRPFPTTDAVFVDFLHRCLTWDPLLRMKPAEALTHPFVASSSKILSLRRQETALSFQP